ncbi:hypothetical protein BGW38_006266 [Lunasporangiospora selenospora]|uniref:Pentatricopeptide repeat protein n=1 Tax=Lunasporangiospora selenospora TaxID=979761 RepID=A0A9P6G4D1_9FUNG|nr:hypothetical protein BGW38_006266 [Lunasporangiospora selenospora]
MTLRPQPLKATLQNNSRHSHPTGLLATPGAISKDTLNISPVYEIKEGIKDAYRLDSYAFNPFENYSPSKLGERYSESIYSDFQDSNTASIFNFWPKSFLSASPLLRQDVIRSGSRLDSEIYSVESCDPSKGSLLHEDVDRSQFQSVHASDSPSRSYQESEFYLSESDREGVISGLLERIQCAETTITLRELETTLERLGQAALEEKGLGSDFLHTTSNKDDVVRTGLNVAVEYWKKKSTLPHWGIRIVDVLNGFNMIKDLERVNLFRLQASLPKKRNALEDRKRKDLIEKALLNLRHRSISREEWKAYTRRFRLQLALARRTGQIPDVKEYGNFMKLCVKGSQYQELELALQHFIAHNGRPDESMFLEYIKGLSRQGNMTQAQEAFFDMKQRGLQVRLAAYGTLIDGYGRQRDFQRMELILKSLYAAGHQPTVEIFTSMMSNYIRAGQLPQAEQVFSKLKMRNDIVLDQHCQNVIADLLRMRGANNLDDLPLLRHIIDILQKEDTGAIHLKARSPLNRLSSLVTINRKLKGYLDAMDTPNFILMYKKLLRQGHKPNTTTYNILLDAVNKTGRLEDGLDILALMKTTDYGKPNAVTYSTLIYGAVHSAKADTAWELYDEMMSKNVAPTLYTYVSLIELIGLDPRHTRGRQIVKQHFISGKHSFRFPISVSLEKKVGLNFAAQVYNQLCNQGLTPNEYIFGGLLDMALRDGFMQFSQHVYLQMLIKKVGPNTAIMTALLKGFAIQRDFESGKKVWKAMLEENIPRNVVTYHHLIRLCERTSLQDSSMALNDSTEGKEMKPKRPSRKEIVAKKQSALDPHPELLSTSTQGRKEGEEESEPRIPPLLMAEIRAQMELDHVHWARLQQFRKKVVDKAIWTPVARDVGPVIAYNADERRQFLDETELEEMNGGLLPIRRDGLVDKSLMEQLPLRLSTDEDGQRAYPERNQYPENSQVVDTTLSEHSSGSMAEDDSEESVKIKELFTGGGDGYIPQRAPTAGTRLVWQSKPEQPTIAGRIKGNGRKAASKT